MLMTADDSRRLSMATAMALDNLLYILTTVNSEHEVTKKDVLSVETGAGRFFPFFFFFFEYNWKSGFLLFFFTLCLV
jgi:hypothetical protein